MDASRATQDNPENSRYFSDDLGKIEAKSGYRLSHPPCDTASRDEVIQSKMLHLFCNSRRNPPIANLRVSNQAVPRSESGDLRLSIIVVLPDSEDGTPRKGVP
jgi:hypothetical protein